MELHKPKRKLKLTSLFFTIGLFLMMINFLMDITNIFSNFQPHTVGASATALLLSIVAQLGDNTA